ncbi:leucine-rich repeats and immunoglobulin-like domains protein 3 [Patiria miniata]|uniref:Uncharacterized protein n=1 Tax=Patiria miniata TaxID=46514 RepID=A0A913ZSV9_PATMI|nr:leucine-rich repeats and immunoglobulin-like domains protein 3 [Patiria miniata]
MAKLTDLSLSVALLILGLVSTVLGQIWPGQRYCPCICARLSTPELTYALGPGVYKQVDCRYRNVNDVPSNIPRDTQVLLLSHNGIINISDNIDYLYDLLYLDISHNHLSGVYFDDVRKNTKLSFINLGWNDITYITPRAFRFIMNLNHLILTSNKLVYVPEAISNLTSLGILDLAKNRIQGLYTNSLQGLPNLQFLNLQENRIGEVNIGSFYQLPQLRTLHLNDNIISYLPSQVFNGLSFLEVLSLNNNLLQNLYPGVFNAMYNIRTIDLHGNTLNHLSRETFHGLSSLENLYLNANNLRNLPSTLFQGLYNLRILDISDNTHIGTFPFGLLYGLHNLETLKISNAQHVPQGLFAGLRKMQSLKIKQSRLPEISATLFRDLSSLQILELPENHIATLQPNSFSSLWTLTTLDLSNNEIKSINNAPFYGTNFYALTTLHLQNNVIDELEDGAFTNMPQLQEVRLDNNNIPVVRNGIFSWRTQLRSITLDHNQIHTIEEGAVRAMDSIDRMTVVSNFLSCDCHLISFAKWFQQNWQNVERANEVYCYAPQVYNNRRLIDMINGPRNPFQCVYPRISTEPKIANFTKFIGEDVYLHCHLIPTAVATLTWVFPDQHEEDAPSFPPLMNQTVRALTNHYGTLILYNIQRKDAGSYKCKSTNTVGADTIVYNIKVLERIPATPVTTPRIDPVTDNSDDGTTTLNLTPHEEWPGQGPGTENETVTTCNPNPCQNEGSCSEEPNEQSTESTSIVSRESSEFEKQNVVRQAGCICRKNYGGNFCQYRKPDMPKEVTVIASNKNYISLTWEGSDMQNVQGYRVLYSIVGERTVVKSVPIHPTVQSYTMEGLETGVSYKICVVAFNQGGESTVGDNDCIWAETQKAAQRTNSIFNTQFLTIGGSCLAVVVLLILMGYGYQKIQERRHNKDAYDEPMMQSNMSPSSSVAEVFRKSMRTTMPSHQSSFYRNSDDVMLIDLQGLPDRQMYMNPMDSRQSLHLGDAPLRDFVPGEPELFPKGNKRKTLKIQDTQM